MFVLWQQETLLENEESFYNRNSWKK